MPSPEQLEASRPLRRQRRDKYIPKACQACRNRKIKCSGHDTCLNCVDRGTECIYNSERRKRGRKAASRSQNYTGDSGNSQANPYDTYALPERISAVEEPQVRDLAQVMTASDHNPAPYAPLSTAMSPRTTAIPTIPVSSFQTGSEPSAIGTTISVPLQLPPSLERSWLLQQYFDNFHPAYPFLDQEDCETQLSRTLAQLGCHDTDLNPPAVLAVDSKTSSFLALVFAIWALGKSVSGVSTEAAHDDRLAGCPPGYLLWSNSRRLLQTFDGLQPPSLDAVRCHVLISIYALHANMLDVSLQSHATATRLLPIVDTPSHLRGNQQGRSTGDIHLWWNIFILDCTLSRMSNTPYMLRLGQLPDEIQRDLETPWWQEQRCRRSPLGVPDLGSQNGLNGTATLDETSLYLRAMGSLCNMWSSFSDHISKPRHGNHCTLRHAALLDTELQVFAASLPAELKWGAPEPPGIPEGDESNTSRRLSILLSTNILRLLLRGVSPATCTCFTKTTTGDGRGVACETIRACLKVNSRVASGPFVLGFAITITTALVYSTVLFLDVFDDEEDDEGESERISELIEEGYGFLMQLAPTSKFASRAVSSLDERLGCSEDDLELRGSKTPGPPALGLDTPSDDRPTQGLILAEGTSPARNTIPGGGSMEMEGGNSLLDDLQTGYGELDTISLGRM